MHPILFKIGDVSLYTYGLFVALGFMAALGLTQREARRLGEPPGMVMDLGFLMLIAGIVGARAMFLIQNVEMVLADPLEALRIWRGGLVFYGGFVAALLAALVWVKKKEHSFFRVADMFAPGLAAGHALGRVGCFFAGCCYGRSCDLPWAVTFHHAESLAPLGVALHPTQLYSVLVNFGIFLVLWWGRKRVLFPGQLFWGYVLLYGLCRAGVEYFRGDPRGATLWGVLSVSQALGLAMAGLAIGMLCWLWRKHGAAAG